MHRVLEILGCIESLGRWLESFRSTSGRLLWIDGVARIMGLLSSVIETHIVRCGWQVWRYTVRTNGNCRLKLYFILFVHFAKYLTVDNLCVQRNFSNAEHYLVLIIATLLSKRCVIDRESIWHIWFRANCQRHWKSFSVTSWDNLSCLSEIRSFSPTLQ